MQLPQVNRKLILPFLFGVLISLFNSFPVFAYNAQSISHEQPSNIFQKLDVTSSPKPKESPFESSSTSKQKTAYNIKPRPSNVPKTSPKPTSKPTQSPKPSLEPTVSPSPSPSPATSVSFIKHGGFESGNFGEFEQSNVTNGTMEIISTTPFAREGSKFAKATINGGGNAYARVQWEKMINIGDTFKAEGYYFLPSGFYDQMKGSIQLLGWDTWPVADNTMRLIIWESDKKARLFLKSDGVDSILTSTFTLPENKWIHLVVEQKIDHSNGWSKVYLDGVLAASGNGDTATPHQIHRMRYGIVAIDATKQVNPLTLYLDDVRLSIY